MKFSELYKPGDKLWFVDVNYLTGKKELVYGHVRTIYDNVLILTDEEDCSSHVISISEIEQIFADEHSAKVCMSSIVVAAKYGGKQ